MRIQVSDFLFGINMFLASPMEKKLVKHFQICATADCVNIEFHYSSCIQMVKIHAF